MLFKVHQMSSNARLILNISMRSAFALNSPHQLDPLRR